MHIEDDQTRCQTKTVYIVCSSNTPYRCTRYSFQHLRLCAESATVLAPNTFSACGKSSSAKRCRAAPISDPGMRLIGTGYILDRLDNR